MTDFYTDEIGDMIDLTNSNTHDKSDKGLHLGIRQNSGNLFGHICSFCIPEIHFWEWFNSNYIHLKGSPGEIVLVINENFGVALDEKDSINQSKLKELI